MELKTKLKTNTFIYRTYKCLKRLKKNLINSFYYYLNLLKIIKYKNQGVKRDRVIYTCISGEYDTLKNFKYFDLDWDYICYTNQQRLLNGENKTIWKILPMQFEELDQIRNARWHKIFPNKLFGKKYKESIWVDGNINIKNKSFFDKIYRSQEIFISAVHPTRNCIYQEAQACKELKKDSEIIIDNQIEALKNKKFPKNMGLYESNIIYRKHNNKIIQKTMIDWWSWVRDYSRRDQLSLNYVCWKNKIKFKTFNKWDYRRKNQEINIIEHL